MKLTQNRYVAGEIVVSVIIGVANFLAKITNEIGNDINSLTKNYQASSSADTISKLMRFFFVDVLILIYFL